MKIFGQTDSNKIPIGWEFVRFGVPSFGDYYINACGYVLYRPMYREWGMDYAIERVIVRPSFVGVS
jgi:hypothetical protein